MQACLLWGMGAGGQHAPMDDALLLRGLPALFLGRVPVQAKFEFQEKWNLTSLLRIESYRNCDCRLKIESISIKNQNLYIVTSLLLAAVVSDVLYQLNRD